MLGCDLGTLNPSSTILCHRKAKQAWCALGRSPAEWLAEKRGVCVTQNTESAGLWLTPSIGPVGGTAEHTHVSVCVEPTGSLTRDSAPRNATHSFHSLLYLWLKPLFIFHAYGAESTPHPSLLQFYIVLLAGATKTIKDSISTQQLLESILLAFTVCTNSDLVSLLLPSTFLENSSLGETGFEVFHSPPPCIFSVPFNSFSESCSAIPLFWQHLQEGFFMPGFI